MTPHADAGLALRPCRSRGDARAAERFAAFADALDTPHARQPDRPARRDLRGPHRLHPRAAARAPRRRRDDALLRRASPRSCGAPRPRSSAPRHPAAAIASRSAPATGWSSRSPSGRCCAPAPSPCRSARACRPRRSSASSPTRGARLLIADRRRARAAPLAGRALPVAARLVVDGDDVDGARGLGALLPARAGRRPRRRPRSPTTTLGRHLLHLGHDRPRQGRHADAREPDVRDPERRSA